MAGATLWLALTAVGFLLLRFMDDISKDTLKAIAVRAAAFSFAGAGSVGAAGWLGTTIATSVATVNQAGAEAGASVIGTGAVWILWAVASLAWILTLLPESWFKRDMPDWLSVSGLVLPALAAGIPGPFGAFVTRVLDFCGGLMIGLMHRVVG